MVASHYSRVSCFHGEDDEWLAFNWSRQWVEKESLLGSSSNSTLQLIGKMRAHISTGRKPKHDFAAQRNENRNYDYKIHLEERSGLHDADFDQRGGEESITDSSTPQVGSFLALRGRASET